MEIWKNIKDFPKYEVSNLGNIRNKTTLKMRKLNSNGRGYLIIRLTNEYESKTMAAHLIVWDHFGNMKRKDTRGYINMLDGNKSNIAIDNLFIDDKKDWLFKKNTSYVLKTAKRTGKGYDDFSGHFKTLDSALKCFEHNWADSGIQLFLFKVENSRNVLVKKLKCGEKKPSKVEDRAAISVPFITTFSMYNYNNLEA